MWPNTENSIVIYFCTLFILCLLAYVLMSQSTSKEILKIQTKKKKAVDQADPRTRLLLRKVGMFKSCIGCMSYESFDLCMIFNGSIDTDLFFLQMLFSVL